MKSGRRDPPPFFKCVKPLPDYWLQIKTGTGHFIFFNFTSRLHTTRFADLKQLDMFNSAITDGHYLIFHVPGKMPVRITDCEFVRMLATDPPERL